ncbi:MAG: 2Fe-2S iron-sulfur cluster-binding protein [Alphaproteobacteria bacterium]|nr:2Fe-2S iron-sulfur cluster-binding protein [Alphaproteobacteria bacterium]
MASVVFITADGTRHDVQAEDGLSLMHAATASGVPGIDADCFGACACATCAVTIGAEWADTLPPPDLEERAMLADLPAAEPCTRLSCQIIASPLIEGITLHIPEVQAR